MEHPSGWDLYCEYVDEITNINRFFLPPKFVRLFEAVFCEKSNVYTASPSIIFYRGRVNKPREKFTSVSELRGNKYANVANRASPMGISYTYLASNPETVISEVRPNIGQTVTIAEYCLNETKKFFSLDYFAFADNKEGAEFSGKDISCFVLYLSYAFATPCNHNRELDYLPCQYFAEYCKRAGFSGIRYKSAARGFYNCEDDYNYVIFEDSDLVFQNASEYVVKEINYVLSEPEPIALVDTIK